MAAPCARGAAQARDEGHALFYLEQISECFSAPSVGGILARLDAGGSLWHEQAAHALRRASPLMLELTHELLTAAAVDQCWTAALRLEAELCTRALAAPDCHAGATALAAAKAEMLRTAAELAAPRDEWEDGLGDDAAGAEDDFSRAEEEEAGGPIEAPVAWEHASEAEVGRAAVEAYIS